MKNKLILISGHCAAGKSTFAEILGETLSLPVFRKDRIKETLGNGLGRAGELVYDNGSTTARAFLAQ